MDDLKFSEPHNTLPFSSGTSYYQKIVSDTADLYGTLADNCSSMFFYYATLEKWAADYKSLYWTSFDL